MTVLVVAAHPDDEVLGCGGTISKLSRDGHEIHVAILGEGITSRYDRREDAKIALVEELRDSSRQVAQLLGVKEILLHDFPDNRFDTVPLLDIIKLIEKLIDKVRPRIIFTHHGGDLNNDHVITHRALLTATRPASVHRVDEIYAFEVPSSTEWAFGQFAPRFRPNVFVDISTTMKIKLQAMQLYKNELKSFPHPRSIKILQNIAQRWGSNVGLKTAEAFELIRSIRGQ
jgi:LmbE family N-acetylglucosaminyl deacetylase